MKIIGRIIRLKNKIYIFIHFKHVSLKDNENNSILSPNVQTMTMPIDVVDIANGREHGVYGKINIDLSEEIVSELRYFYNRKLEIIFLFSCCLLFVFVVYFYIHRDFFVLANWIHKKFLSSFNHKKNFIFLSPSRLSLVWPQSVFLPFYYDWSKKRARREWETVKLISKDSKSYSFRARLLNYKLLISQPFPFYRFQLILFIDFCLYKI